MYRVTPGVCCWICLIWSGYGPSHARCLACSAAADSLFTFLAQRFAASWDILGCADLIHLANPITVSANADGVVTAASINTITYSRRRQSLSSCQRQDDSDDDASKAATASE